MDTLIHKINGGSLAAGIYDTYYDEIGVNFVRLDEELIDLVRVNYNQVKDSINIYVYANPYDEEFTDKFEINMLDINKALEGCDEPNEDDVIICSACGNTIIDKNYNDELFIKALCGNVDLCEFCRKSVLEFNEEMYKNYYSESDEDNIIDIEYKFLPERAVFLHNNVMHINIGTTDNKSYSFGEHCIVSLDDNEIVSVYSVPI